MWTLSVFLSLSSIQRYCLFMLWHMISKCLQFVMILNVVFNLNQINCCVLILLCRYGVCPCVLPKWSCMLYCLFLASFSWRHCPVLSSAMCVSSPQHASHNPQHWDHSLFTFHPFLVVWRAIFTYYDSLKILQSCVKVHWITL